MRSLLVALILFGFIPFILKRPWVGVLVFIWVSVMNPHRLTFGFAFNFPWAMIIASATLVGMLFSRDRGQFPVRPATLVMILLMMWMTLTTVLGFEPDLSFIQWKKVMKIQFFLLVTLFVLHTRQHIHLLIWVLAGSIAFFGVKGGIFTILGGGQERVFGPADTFIAENNALALAIIMTIPLLRYLQIQATDRRVRWGLMGAMILCGFSALGSQSRGALLALGAMLVFFWLKSRNKFVTAVILAVMVPAAIGFMPDKWTKRMYTMQEYEEDGSAQGRFIAWDAAYRIAKERPLVGGGFEINLRHIWARVGADTEWVRAQHSIYFQMMGEHGFVGLGIFLLLWFLTWREAAWIIRRVRDLPEWHWASDLARMIQAAIIAYVSGGAFLSLAYFDVPYDLMIAVVLTRVLVEKELKGTVATAGYGRPAAQPANLPSPRNGAPVVRRN